MGLKGRIGRIEAEATEAMLRQRVGELAAQHGLNAEEVMAEALQIRARLRLLMSTHPLPSPKGKPDIEPYLRMLAEEDGLDPEKVVEEARQPIEKSNASKAE